MNYFTNTPVGRFRLVAVIEGVSYLALLLIAMPLKYFYASPMAVTYTGWVHGLFFMLYIVTLQKAASEKGWPFKRTFVFLLLSLVPFGSFWVDRKLHREEKEALAVSTENA
ncbi:MAG: DUF3817 domain-containing protein [Chitinophagaceae bacterium]|nr:DUF3817 domain-containing protein [Chitinophagaceae bacterium]